MSNYIFNELVLFLINKHLYFEFFISIVVFMRREPISQGHCIKILVQISTIKSAIRASLAGLKNRWSYL